VSCTSKSNEFGSDSDEVPPLWPLTSESDEADGLTDSDASDHDEVPDLMGYSDAEDLELAPAAKIMLAGMMIDILNNNEEETANGPYR
jgi:hypothetical protein